MHEVLVCEREVEGVIVEVALQWCSDAFADTLVGFANSIRTVDGGTHLDGLKTALTRTVNSLGGSVGHEGSAGLGVVLGCVAWFGVQAGWQFCAVVYEALYCCRRCCSRQSTAIQLLCY